MVKCFIYTGIRWPLFCYLDLDQLFYKIFILLTSHATIRWYLRDAHPKTIRNYSVNNYVCALDPTLRKLKTLFWCETLIDSIEYCNKTANVIPYMSKGCVNNKLKQPNSENFTMKNATGWGQGGE